ncbi:MAG: hypothetical protein HY394_04475 [Candidatus Diapherotrites archaeon]|nr:hypothetical protein [Candidatus Diapherotrites archaeon]
MGFLVKALVGIAVIALLLGLYFFFLPPTKPMSAEQKFQAILSDAGVSPASGLVVESAMLLDDAEASALKKRLEGFASTNRGRWAEAAKVAASAVDAGQDTGKFVASSLEFEAAYDSAYESVELCPSIPLLEQTVSNAKSALSSSQKLEAGMVSLESNYPAVYSGLGNISNSDVLWPVDGQRVSDLEEMLSWLKAGCEEEKAIAEAG